MQESFAVNSNTLYDDKGLKGMSGVDVRAKLIITFGTSIAAIAISSIYAQIVLLLASLIYAFYMRKPKVMALTYLFVVMIMAAALASLFIINMFVNFMEGRSYFALTVPFMRMVTMVNVLLPLAFTTNIQSILTALKSFNLPLFIYIPVAVMIRFIPAFISDIKQIIESLATRGVEVSFTSFFKHPLLMGRYLFMPLLFRSLRASEELGIAAELKGIGLSDKVRPYKTLKFTAYDMFLIIGFISVIFTAFMVQSHIEVPQSLRSLHR